MAVAADYARVVDALHRPLPAYVSFVQHDRVSGMGDNESEARVVVRTSDRKVVHGKAPDAGSVERPVFDPACYQATGERTVTLDGRSVLAFDLRPTCGDSDRSPFTTLYADAATNVPLEASGDHYKDHARVRVDLTFTQAQGHAVPASLIVAVDGDGAAFWLHVHVDERYRDYRFFPSDPGA